MGCIYQIRFKGSARSYIGSARKLRHRINTHLSLLRKGKHHSRPLQRAFNKYGEPAIEVFEIESDLAVEFLISREQHYLDLHAGELYNRSPTASSRLGVKETAKTRSLRSALLIGNKHRLGIPHDAESLRKISEGVRRAFAEGRRPPSGTKFLDAYWGRVKAGQEPHPTKRLPAYNLHVLSRLATLRSRSAVAGELGVTFECVSVIVNAAFQEIEEKMECAIGTDRYVAGDPKRRLTAKHVRGKFIHPDHFDQLEDYHVLHR
jgi:group I intron endonuclease